jgi:hypothetical protein
MTINDLAERLHVPGTLIDEIVDDLEDHRLVLTAEDESVAPARDLENDHAVDRSSMRSVTRRRIRATLSASGRRGRCRGACRR